MPKAWQRHNFPSKKTSLDKWNRWKAILQQGQNKRLIIDERTDIHAGNSTLLAENSPAGRGKQGAAAASNIAVRPCKNDHACTPSRTA